MLLFDWCWLAGIHVLECWAAAAAAAGPLQFCPFPFICRCLPARLPAEEAIAAVKGDGITQLVVLPLYPQFSVSTSGSSLRLLEKLLKEDPVLAQVRRR